MENTIKSKIEDIKSKGEIYIKISAKKYKHFWVMEPAWLPIKKGQIIEIKLWSCIHPKMSKNHERKVKIVNSHLVDYNGLIVGEIEKYFLIDATLPIIVDKEPSFKVGDYVTGGFNHTIQARLVTEGKNYEK